MIVIRNTLTLDDLRFVSVVESRLDRRRKTMMFSPRQLSVGRGWDHIIMKKCGTRSPAGPLPTLV